MSEKKKFNFYEWYESDPVKKAIGAVYSLGAAVVIVGALFKIMHFPGAGPMLCVGMITEAILFAIGILDRPHPEYKWDNIFPSLTGKEAKPITSAGTEANGGVANNSLLMTGAPAAASTASAQKISDADMQKLTNSIKNLAATADQLSSLSSIAGPTEKLAKSMDMASAATEKFAGTQDGLSKATQGLETSYQTITTDMDSVVKNTHVYADKIEQVNTNLSSLNSVYELQLKNIQAQTAVFGQQNEKMSIASGHLDNICNEMSKIQQAAVASAKESEAYKAGISKLSGQISDLNKVYGNMLNALS